jgi:hypothetical protein
MWFWKKRKGKTRGSARAKASRHGGVEADPVESFREAADRAGLRPEELFLSILFELDGAGVARERGNVLVGDGENVTGWHVDSLRSLFRGNRSPPSVGEMEVYPPRYVPFFHRVEYNVFRYCRTMDLDPVDNEFLEIYSNMRRRPDGKSLGPLHDTIWQSAALVLGFSPWSEAEYTAVFGQLARSARHFRIGPTSRNYIEYVRETMEDSESAAMWRPNP